MTAAGRRAARALWCGASAAGGDGRGRGLLDDIRIALEDKPICTTAGTLLLAVGGRSTVEDPRGAFLPLNRCWVLESLDDGETWATAHLIGGSDSPRRRGADHRGCRRRPARVPDAGAVQHRPRGSTRASARTMAAPGAPRYRPGCPTRGVRHQAVPAADRRWPVRVARVQRAGDAGRTGASVYLTDSEGLLAGRWPRKKTLLIESPGEGMRPPTGWVATDGSHPLGTG